MATYLVLNCLFLAPVLAIAWLTKKLTWSRQLLLSMIVLIVATALFDSLIINLGIVDYDKSKLLNIYIGSAPVEDFFYALLASIGIPLIWLMQQKESNK